MTAPAPAVYGSFATTIDAAFRLCPEAERVTDPNESRLPNPITEDTIAAWIVEVSDLLGTMIGEWDELTGATATRVIAGCRAAVANGAASYMEAARYPTQQSGYAATLWARFLAIAAALAETIAHEIGEGGGDVEPPADASGGAPYAAFPATYFTDADPLYPWVQPLDPSTSW